MRECKTCGVKKSLDEFYAHARYRDGRKPVCKACAGASQVKYAQRPEVRERRRAQDRARRAKNPVPREEIRRQRLWTWYRITPAQFEAMLEAQGGRCGIPACGAAEPGGRGAWHVDHDHACCPGSKSCGKCVRGLLCARCNVMLGMARDNAAILLAGAEYVTNAALQALGAIGQTG